MDESDHRKLCVVTGDQHGGTRGSTEGTLSKQDVGQQCRFKYLQTVIDQRAEQWYTLICADGQSEVFQVLTPPLPTLSFLFHLFDRCQCH